MCPRADAVPDPEAQRPPAPPGPACRPLPWALSVALLLLLLLAGTCAACWLSAWVAPAASAAPGPSLPRVPEQPPDARARLPDSPQVRCAPAPRPPSAPLASAGLRGGPSRRPPVCIPGPGPRGLVTSNR